MTKLQKIAVTVWVLALAVGITSCMIANITGSYAAAIINGLCLVICLVDMLFVGGFYVIRSLWRA